MRLVCELAMHMSDNSSRMMVGLRFVKSFAPKKKGLPGKASPSMHKENAGGNSRSQWTSYPHSSRAIVQAAQIPSQLEPQKAGNRRPSFAITHIAGGD